VKNSDQSNRAADWPKGRPRGQGLHRVIGDEDGDTLTLLRHGAADA